MDEELGELAPGGLFASALRDHAKVNGGIDRIAFMELADLVDSGVKAETIESEIMSMSAYPQETVVSIMYEADPDYAARVFAAETEMAGGMDMDDEFADDEFADDEFDVEPEFDEFADDEFADDEFDVEPEFDEFGADDEFADEEYSLDDEFDVDDEFVVDEGRGSGSNSMQRAGARASANIAAARRKRDLEQDMPDLIDGEIVSGEIETDYDPDYDDYSEMDESIDDFDTENDWYDDNEPATNICTDCDGAGCEMCDHTGEIFESRSVIDESSECCVLCDGTGIDELGHQCSDCMGSGESLSEQTQLYDREDWAPANAQTKKTASQGNAEYKALLAKWQAFRG